ncbi:GGDEF domain-containing protein, partial [Rhizobium johnstonii]|uniref:GGDEF domain-containing protein n=1 Tax=Rhizobium johnstonii TaxID=3019933 RepID=UPI003F976BE3
VNDGYGHLQGDEVLKAIAARLGTTLLSSDRVFRFGGEEFVAFCPGTGHEEGLLLAERIDIEQRRAPDHQPAHLLEEVDVGCVVGR